MQKRISHGFTIVELLVVIVVIGILAAITIVSFTGISNRANIAAIQSDLKNATTQIELSKTLDPSELYPLDSASINEGRGLNSSEGISYDYIYNSIDNVYCVSATHDTTGIAYHIYSNIGIATEGGCVTAIPCPTGFINVPGSSTYGTSDFCVMKYEAKIAGNDNGNQAYNSAFVPESRASGTPWGNVSQTNAIAESQTVCDGCHLITEAEWMTIAQNVLSVGSNWSGGVVGSGYVFSGHNDNIPNGLLAANIDSEPYSGTGNFSGDSSVTNGMIGNTQRRTLTLTNGQVIWDMAGNTWEMINATIAGGQQPGLLGESTFTWKQWNDVSLLMNGLPATSHPNSTGITGVSDWTSAQGIGRLYSNYGQTGLRSFIRGGVFDSSGNGGIFTLFLSTQPSSTGPFTGFRVSQ